MKTNSGRILMLVALIAMVAGSNAFGYNTLQTVHSDWRFASGLSYGFSGDNHVYDFASYVDFYEGAWADHGLGGTWLGTNSREPLTMTWSHLLPSLDLPDDRITRARLWIDAAYVDNSNNLVNIGGTWDWDPLNHSFLDNTTYNLGSIDDPDVWNGGQLAVTVHGGENRLRIDRAILMLDYDSGTDDSGETPGVPEPATLVLFGSGLVGFGAMIRRQRRNR